MGALAPLIIKFRGQALPEVEHVYTVIRYCVLSCVKKPHFKVIADEEFHS